MKRVGSILILLCLWVAPVLATPVLPPITSVLAQDRVAAWTVMVYMAADNNLEPFALADLNEMELVGSSEAVNIVVQVDRAADYDTSDGNWTETRRYVIQKDRRATSLASEQVDGGTLGETDTSDPATLVNFGTWAITTYPAERYALVIWDHGGSWQGLATDESAGKQDLILPELTSALAQITANTGVEKLDLIGFDACLMGSFEVYRAIAPYGHFAVASAELIPGEGWDYFGAWDALAADPTMGGDVLGRAIVDSFMIYYTDIVTKYKIFNLGVVDLDQSAEVEAALGEITAVMRDESGEAWAAIVAARTQTLVYGAFGDPQYIDIWAAADLIQFAGLLKDQSENPALASAAEHAHTAGMQMVVYYRSSADPDAPATNQRGVSIYFPRTANLFEQRAESVRYPQEVPAGLSLWTNFLTTFFATVRTQADADALGGKVQGVQIDGAQAALVFDMAGGKPVTRASSLVKFDIGNHQRVVLYYTEVPPADAADAADAAYQSQAGWSGSVPWLTNGRSETPVLVLRHPRDPNMGVVNGTLYPRAGSPVAAQLLFDLTTNDLISVWSMTQSASAMMPSQIMPGQGDIFHPMWLSSAASNAWELLPASVQFGFDESTPLRLEWRRAPVGAYQVTLNVEDAAGNTARDALSVAITGSDETALVIETIDPADPDIDGDSVPNKGDNCPVIANPDQQDTDRDGVGDVCDLFDDTDLDGDGIPASEDVCPGLYDPDQAGEDCAFFADADRDGIPDDLDLCPDVANPFQGDLDGDMLGNACDDTLDGVDEFDLFDYYDDCDPLLDPDCDLFAGDYGGDYSGDYAGGDYSGASGSDYSGGSGGDYGFSDGY